MDLPVEILRDGRVIAALITVAAGVIGWLLLRTGGGLKALWGRGTRSRERSGFEATYRKWVVAEHRYLPLKGIKTRTQARIELDQVYVGLELRRRPGLAAPPFDRLSEQVLLFSDEERPGSSEDDRSTLVLIDDPESILHESSLQELRRRYAIRETVVAEQPYEVGEALRSLGDKLVFLGGPGSGKTTLLKYLALVFARDEAAGKLDLDEHRLPIFVPLRTYVRDGEVQPLTADTLTQYAVYKDILTDCPEGFFREQLRAGRCIVLLDGMDEVTREGQRSEMAGHIEALVNAYPGNRFIVTSRPAGYEGVSLAGFSILHVRDFSPEDVARFVDRWYEAVELAAIGENADEIGKAVAKRRAVEQAEHLTRAIQASDRVQRLTVNPLLLTIVALVHSYRAVLPGRRVELYDECVQVLLNYWDAS